jgi:teichuronic acid biosynthesis glycosyltransferase TuaH
METMSEPAVKRSPCRSESVTALDEIVVCSLEAWDDVWRRNQFLVDALLEMHPRLRVLFVEPPADPLNDIVHGRSPAWRRARSVRPDGRLHALRPLKPLPRLAGRLADRQLHRQVTAAARRLGFARPKLWINDVTYAPLIAETGWPALYDVTDDWLAAPVSRRQLGRLSGLEERVLKAADEVVVCSPGLARSRGGSRPVTLVPNAVDSEHFRRLRSRPADLPGAPVAVYVGTLHESRLDVDLVARLARELPHVSVALVGPVALSRASRRALTAEPNVTLLGPRPYADVPGYLQHADVVVVPHGVDAFTGSLDPIKLYECLAVATPTVATPVAGFDARADSIRLARRDTFVDAVRVVLDGGGPDRHPETVPSWRDRAEEFGAILGRI